MAKADKVATVAQITEQFRSSNAAVITEYRGLTMSQLTELRRAMGSDTAYTVAKNTLVKRAAADAGVAGLDDLFTGPTAVAFISGEPVDAAKALREFARTHPLLVIKGGYLEGKALDPTEVGKLADLETREVLLAKMAGAMLGTLTKAAVMFNQLPSQVARLAAALQEQRAADAPAPAAESTDSVDSVASTEAPESTEAPAAEAPEAEAPVAEVPVAVDTVAADPEAPATV